MKILLIEDDEKISKFITKGLEEEYCNVDTVLNAEDGLYLCSIHEYDVIILDWMLPKLSGLEFIEELRFTGANTPILMLTAKGDLGDKILGLEKGADDYMSKPFSFIELVARVKALHRRNIKKDQHFLVAENIKLDSLKRVVTCDNTEITLTMKEFALLEYLMENKGRLITNTMISEHIWNMQEVIKSNVITVTMYNLRRKIYTQSNEELIETIRGAGYRIKE